MKWLLMFVLSFFWGASTFGAEIPFYLGTMTDHSTSRGIYRGSLETDTGKLGPLVLATEAQNPNFLALSPDGKFLYAAATNGGKSAVAAFARQSDGSLKLLNTQPSGGDGACHVAVDATGRNVFVANYGGGNIACFPIQPDGSLGGPTSLQAFTGSGPDPLRQRKPYAHSIYLDAANKFVYACDLGSDHVWIFKFDAAHGTLTPNDPPAAPVPPGSGPRHLAFSPSGAFVYVVNEMGCSVTAFSRNAQSGSLTALQTVSLLPPGTSTKNVTAAEIFCHPSGRWLYASTRGLDTLAVLSLAPDGRLTLLQSTSSIVKFPRSFALDPTGHWLIAAGQKDNRLAVLKIDPATGQLSATDQSAEVGAPVCVLFVPANRD